MRHGKTPPTWPPFISHRAVDDKIPEVSVKPYASNTGVLKTTVKNFFTSFESGAPPERIMRKLPPKNYLNGYKTV